MAAERAAIKELRDNIDMYRGHKGDDGQNGAEGTPGINGKDGSSRSAWILGIVAVGIAVLGFIIMSARTTLLAITTGLVD